jgi:hypothetical protein
MGEVTPKMKQWLGAEVPWADYRRAIDYVNAHKAQGMTVGKLIVAAMECYFSVLHGKPATTEVIVNLLGFDPAGVVVPPKAEAGKVKPESKHRKDKPVVASAPA